MNLKNGNRFLILLVILLLLGSCSKDTEPFGTVLMSPITS
jgi:hypothetical protein